MWKDNAWCLCTYLQLTCLSVWFLYCICWFTVLCRLCIKSWRLWLWAMNEAGFGNAHVFRPLKIIRVHAWCVHIACLLHALLDSDPEVFKDSRFSQLRVRHSRSGPLQRFTICVARVALRVPFSSNPWNTATRRGSTWWPADISAHCACWREWTPSLVLTDSGTMDDGWGKIYTCILYSDITTNETSYQLPVIVAPQIYSSHCSWKRSNICSMLIHSAIEQLSITSTFIGAMSDRLYSNYWEFTVLAGHSSCTLVISVFRMSCAVKNELSQKIGS